METASCMLLLSTCGVFRTQTWSWGRRSSALSRRRIHATSNSGGSWSPLNLRNLWKRGFATTLGYVNKCSAIKYLPVELPGRWRVSLARPCSQGAYDVLGHVNLAKQSRAHGKHQKAPVGWTWGFCHCWEVSRQQIPSCGSLPFSKRASLLMAFPVGLWLLSNLIALCMLYWACQADSDVGLTILSHELGIFVYIWIRGSGVMPHQGFFWKQVLSPSSPAFKLAL